MTQIIIEEYRNFWHGKLLECYTQKDWKMFCNIGVYPEVMDIAFQYFDEVPDEYKFDFAIDAYSHYGDNLPIVRKSVRKLKGHFDNQLPNDLKCLPFITVYRAGEEPITKAKYRMSWTTEKKIADFFAHEYIHRHAKYIYTGKIKPCNVIAFNNERNESEIIQYANVYDIACLEEI